MQSGPEGGKLETFLKSRSDIERQDGSWGGTAWRGADVKALRSPTTDLVRYHGDSKDAD